MKKTKVFCGAFAFMLGVMLTPMGTVQAVSLEGGASETVCSGEMMIAKAENIGYKYISINGVIYRRLYNFSSQTWIGEWELCP